MTSPVGSRLLVESVAVDALSCADVARAALSGLADGTPRAAKAKRTGKMRMRDRRGINRPCRLGLSAINLNLPGTPPQRRAFASAVAPRLCGEMTTGSGGSWHHYVRVRLRWGYTLIEGFSDPHESTERVGSRLLKRRFYEN